MVLHMQKNATFCIKTFGGIPDGMTLNTAAFTDAFSVIKKSGGGILMVEKGVWLTGPLELPDHCTLFLDTEAVLKFVPDVSLYPPVKTRWEGADCYCFHPLIFSHDAEDIEICGTGTIDGTGEYWWNMIREKRKRQVGPETSEELKLAALNPGYRNVQGGGGGRELQFLRPPLINFYKCTGVRIQDVTVTNSPFWNIHPVLCNEVLIRHVTVIDPFDAPNTDGIDIDSCRNVIIEDCTVSVGDDGIALKSGIIPGNLANPTVNVYVRNCTVNHAHGGIVIGSDMSGGVYNGVVEDCKFHGTNWGIRIKSRRSRGGTIRNLLFRRLTMKDNLCPFVINMFYSCGSNLSSGYFGQEKHPITNETPSVSMVELEDITAEGSKASAGFIAGLPEAPISGLVIKDCLFGVDTKSKILPAESELCLGVPDTQEKGFRIFNVDNPVFENVQITGTAKPFVLK